MSVVEERFVIEIQSEVHKCHKCNKFLNYLIENDSNHEINGSNYFKEIQDAVKAINATHINGHW
jgi:hypothetical protein